MKLRLSTFAIALVLVANAFVLASVAWNRAGEAEAVLELTERELIIPYRGWSGRESTGVSLSIRRADQDYDWLDRDKLAELGFDVERYEHSPRRDWREAEKRAYVVLEYDGPAFEALLAEQEARIAQARAGSDGDEAGRRQVKAAEQAYERLQTAGSRLVVVDAGREAEALRKRYPDREQYAVMRALVRMRARRRLDEDEKAVVDGRVGPFLPGRVHVPRRFHASLHRATDGSRSDYDAPPRYRVVLKFGRRSEPWVAGIEPMASKNKSD